MDTICAYSDIGGSGHVIHWCKLLGQSKILFFMLFLPGPFCCIRLQSTTDSSQVERVEGLPSGSATKILLDIFSEVMSSWSYSILGAKPGMLTRYKFACVLNCSGAELLHDRYIQVWVKFLFVGQLIQCAFKMNHWRIAWILDWDVYEHADMKLRELWLTKMDQEICYCIGDVTAWYLSFT